MGFNGQPTTAIHREKSGEIHNSREGWVKDGSVAACPFARFALDPAGEIIQ
jgi:hypothetical protein